MITLPATQGNTGIERLNGVSDYNWASEIMNRRMAGKPPPSFLFDILFKALFSFVQVTGCQIRSTASSGMTAEFCRNQAVKPNRWIEPPSEVWLRRHVTAEAVELQHSAKCSGFGRSCSERVPLGGVCLESPALVIAGAGH